MTNNYSKNAIKTDDMYEITNIASIIDIKIYTSIYGNKKNKYRTETTASDVF